MKVISISIEEELYNKIKELRDKKAINVSKWISFLIKQALEKEFKS